MFVLKPCFGFPQTPITQVSLCCTVEKLVLAVNCGVFLRTRVWSHVHRVRLQPLTAAPAGSSSPLPIPGFAATSREQNAAAAPLAARCALTRDPCGAHLDVPRFLQEPAADGHQGILGPLVEPVDGCAVDHGREPPRPHPQRGAHGGEAQDHLGRRCCWVGWQCHLLPTAARGAGERRGFASHPLKPLP